MSLKLIDSIFKKTIKKGKLTILFPDEKKLIYGTTSTAYPDIIINVKNESFFKEIINKGNLGIGESYMKDYFSVEKGDISDLLDILLVNRLDKVIKDNPKLLLSVGARRLKDSLKGKSHNIRVHYDIGFDIFRYMLDENLTYSCGYLIKEDDTLNDLQYQKFQRIIDKVQLQNGDTILDIGCGYGSFLIYAAQNYKIKGTGITNSKQHADFANDRIEKLGLADSIKIICDDYKKIKGSYHKVVSIGMLEHVPRKEYKTYFDIIKKVLLPSGAALIHAVGCNTKKNNHDPFTQKYIFPNSNQPKLSEISSHIERTNMAIIDVENIIRHYRPTAKFWLKNFLENKDRLSNSNYTPEFLRCWEYYLNCCVSAARYSDAAVYHVLVYQSHLKHIHYARV